MKKKSKTIHLLLLTIFFWFISFQNAYASNVKLLIIDSQEGEPYISVREALLRNLMDFGYKENKNLTITYYSIGNSEDEFKKIWFSKNESKNQYDAIFTNGTLSSFCCKKYGFGNPEYKFIFCSVTDPVGLGLIDDFTSPPKANFTGVSYPVRIEERLQFIKKAMPGKKTFGLVYADMPQSRSYYKWLQNALRQKEFMDLKIIFSKVPFVEGEKGHIAMAKQAQSSIDKLNSSVDGFISPNDQMGVQNHFTAMVYETATKPLVGLGRKDVMEGWGATLSIYPSLKHAGRQAAVMLKKVFKGIPLSQIKPEWSQTGVTFDLHKAQKFSLQIPQDLLKKAGNDIIKSKSPHIIKVAGNHAPPYRIINNNIYYGFYNDILKELAQRLNLNINFVEVPFARALKMMKMGKCDIMLGPNMDKSRKEYMVYTDVELGIEKKAFYVSEDAQAIRSYEDLYSKRIGTLISKKYFKRFDEDQGLEKDTTISYISAIRKVYYHRNDVVIIPEKEGDYLLKVLGFKLKKSPFIVTGNRSYMTISKKSEFIKMRQAFEQAFRAMKADGTYAKIVSRYR